MNIAKLNKPFVAQTTLTAAQLNNVTDKIDTIIDNLPQSTSSINPSNDLTNEINAAKNWINGKISDIQALISQFDLGNTHIRTDEEMLDLFKGEMGKALLVQYGICDANGNPYFNVLIDRNGIKPAAIIGAITDNNGILNSLIGISADNVIVDANNTTLTGKLTAVEASILSVTANTLTGKHIVGGDINIGDDGNGNYNFSVDPNGNVIANSITLNGQGYWVTIREGQEITTLPNARVGSQVLVFNEMPTAANILEGLLNYRVLQTANINLHIIVWDHENRRWSDEGYRLLSAITNRIVFATFISNGTNWYIAHCKLNNGTDW